MASSHRAPKQWCLSKNESVNSFENWKQNLMYTLSLDPNFAPFLVTGFTWGKKTKNSALRGFVNDPEDIPEARRKTADQKVTILELMLGQIANYCPVIARNSIVRNSTSVDCIWQLIRLHFGFQSTGAHFLDFCNIRLDSDEKPEDLFQRLTAFCEDNLLRKDGNISHHGIIVEDDEELSPSLENFIILTWLRLINSDLPKLVKQRYGTELRTRTLASIKPEISQALESLLFELHTSEDVRAMRTSARQFNDFRDTKPKSTVYRTDPPKSGFRSRKSCPLCLQAGRKDCNHFLSECTYLPEQDRKFIARARQISNILEEDEVPPNIYSEPYLDEPAALRVQTRQSPYFNAFFDYHVARITVDSGATGNMMRLSIAKQFGIEISKSTQSAHQADGTSPLNVVGEVRITFTRDEKAFLFEGLVVEDLDVDILAGTPFMEQNDISVRPARRQVIVGDTTVYEYGSKSRPATSHTVRRAHVLRAPAMGTVVWPGEFLELDIPSDLHSEATLALEPRIECQTDVKDSKVWPPPAFISSVAGKVRIPNMTDTPQLVKKHLHLCQVQSVCVAPGSDDVSTNLVIAPVVRQNLTASSHSETVRLNPDNIIPADVCSQFRAVLLEFDQVFNQRFEGYNGASGPFKAAVNMGPVQPPQRKGRVPQYSRDKLVELQNKFNELEDLGVFVRPEDADVAVEYLNPSFLVKKSNGGFRLVTAFADVGRYSKPQPSLMPDVDKILRHIAQWTYIITTDLTNAFYQIPLSKDSMKYCGVSTPFRGIRVYARSAMGMPGSETALEELMCRVLGDLLEEGCVTKLADDLYIGANSLSDLLVCWRRVLIALHKNGLNLSPKKTVICPDTVTILGWIWNQGSIHASPHKVATLSSCPLPETIRGLRSYIGAYKILARVIPGCSSILSPLDDIVAGCLSNDRIEWSEARQQSFKFSQGTLSNNKAIVLPRPDDILWVVTDGAVKNYGIGATLYVTRKSKLRLAGFFSAKLRGRQPTWIPCEIEALSIAVATKHFSPYMIQSKHKACILTDSKPCVQAFEKLCRGEFSVSPRVSSFLSVVSRYQASVRHLSGSVNIPSDFASRNAVQCETPSCQVCSFIRDTQDSVVRQLSTKDIKDGSAKLPFTSRPAWLEIQSECQDLRRVHAHLIQGTRPSKKLTNIKDVKRYLNITTVAKDGLLVVRRNEGMEIPRDRIVVPRAVVDGLFTSLHIQLDHPTAHQLKLVIRRHFFALDMDKIIENISAQCHRCVSLSKIPHTVHQQSSVDPPDVIGISFAGDVLKREGQLALILRECVTAFTVSCFIDNERAETLREALIKLCVELRPLQGPSAVIRTDPAPGFQALVNDQVLHSHRINIEIGRVKNNNKNPVAEKAVQELENELLRQDPMGGRISSLTLALATARLNTRIRSRGLSSREMWTHRDQFSSDQIPVSDLNLILSQQATRLKNHEPSERSKCPISKVNPPSQISVGDLVYLYTDGTKLRARDRYLVSSIDGIWCSIRKFSGTQLRKTSYRVKSSECYKVGAWSSHPQISHEVGDNDYSSCDEDKTVISDLAQSAPEPPVIPDTFTRPLAYDSSELQVSSDISSQEDHIEGHIPPTDSGVISSPVTDVKCRPKRQRKRPQRFEDYCVDY